jgi:lipopolysaccharide biosynthesis regulator YciM
MVMKYALINGKILNGHQDMEVETGKAIFIENEKIVAIEPYRNLDKSYQIIDLYFARADQYACPSCRKWKTTKETKR